MSDNSRTLAFQAYLAEYKAHQDLRLVILRQRENMLFLSLVITGALYSFYFATSSQPGTQRDYHLLSLYLVVPLCVLTGARWLEQGWDARNIDAYIADIIAPRMNAILKASVTRNEEDAHDLCSVLTGVVDSRRKFSEDGTLKGLRGMIHRVVYYGCFIVPGVVSQLLVLDRGTGDLCQRMSQLAFPIIYYGNWLIMIACMSLPLLRVLGVKFFTPRPGLP